MSSLPDHFFISECDGHLYDTRRADWPHHPLRHNYQRHHRTITTGQDLRATLRAGEFAWPGGYRLYFVTSDGAALSFDAVRDNLVSVLDSIRHDIRDGWLVIRLHSSAEDDEPVLCVHTGEELI